MISLAGRASRAVRATDRASASIRRCEVRTLQHSDVSAWCRSAEGAALRVLERTDMQTDWRTFEIGETDARREASRRTDELRGDGKRGRRRGIEAARRRAMFLGCFSLGLGAAEIVAPG